SRNRGDLAMKIGFEGVAPSNGVAGVPNGYDGFDWGGFGAAGRKWLEKRDPGPGAYFGAIDGKDVGYTDFVMGQNYAESTITLEAAGSFSIDSGRFAAISHNGEQVRFLGFFDGELVATKAVSLDMAGATIHFPKSFDHINELEITTGPT